MTKVENIVRSFRYALEQDKIEAKMKNIKFNPFWFSNSTERSSILLGEVTVEEAVDLYNRYGISSENEDDRITYRVDDLEKFESAIA